MIDSYCTYIYYIYIINYLNLTLQDILQYDGTDIKYAQIERINFKLVPKNLELVNNKFEPTVECKPRTRDPVYIPPKKKKQRIKWTFPISLMYPWKPDDEGKMVRCFEADW